MPTFEQLVRESDKRKERLCHHRIKDYSENDSRYHDESNSCQNKARNGNIYCKEHKHLYHHDDARGQ
jgi:hypothetical protein